MAEIRFKAKKNEVRLNVIVENDEGEQSKELVFDCSPSNYQFVKQSAAIYTEIKKAISGKMTIEKAGTLVEYEKNAFEAVAPGRWNEFIEFLGGDIIYMANLLSLMFETVQTKGAESKLAEIAPVIPDGETV